MSYEKQPKFENQPNPEDLEKLANERREAAAERLERRSPERSAERDKEASRHEALEQAQSAEKERQVAEQAPRSPEASPPPLNSKASRDKAFNSIMTEVRSQMSPASRTFSKVIHVPVVETVSEAASKTVARPNAILAGSFSAFILVLVVYLVARHYGYPLSGAETIVAFTAGWLLGIVFDFLRVMITGKHN